ncbi:MAG: hypothetical protein LC808_12970 [Actinobacteria bacterium]|nr:hypothetical protein [Actinomycetota bacterium]
MIAPEVAEHGEDPPVVELGSEHEAVGLQPDPDPAARASCGAPARRRAAPAQPGRSFGPAGGSWASASMIAVGFRQVLTLDSP